MESPGDPHKMRPRGRQVDFPLRVLVSSDMVGAIIGRGGSTIRNITQQSRARVDVHRFDGRNILLNPDKNILFQLPQNGPFTESGEGYHSVRPARELHSSL